MCKSALSGGSLLEPTPRLPEPGGDQKSDSASAYGLSLVLLLVRQQKTQLGRLAERLFCRVVGGRIVGERGAVVPSRRLGLAA